MLYGTYKHSHYFTSSWLCARCDTIYMLYIYERQSRTGQHILQLKQCTSYLKNPSSLTRGCLYLTSGLAGVNCRAKVKYSIMATESSCGVCLSGPNRPSKTAEELIICGCRRYISNGSTLFCTMCIVV